MYHHTRVGALFARRPTTNPSTKPGQAHGPTAFPKAPQPSPKRAINFRHDDHGSFWTTAMIQNASGCILDHPDDPPDHPDAILDHRDAVLDARNPSSDPRKRLRTALERRNQAPDSILDSRDPACDQKL